MKAISREIYDYWTGRAAGYSAYNQAEMQDERREYWRRELTRQIGTYLPGKKPSEIHILDAGTGPGFFAILLAEMGYCVTAVDTTEAMLREARGNAGELAKEISWVLGDVQELDFHSERFDVVVSRNVTWNLPEPKKAYEEWFRVLSPGGVLLNFDAEWYGYLFSEEKRNAYEEDRKNSALKATEDANVGENFDRMEDIARRIPMSDKRRPAWDVETAKACGFHEVNADEEMWQRVWSEDEKISWASTPMFLLAARKQDPKERIVSYWAWRSASFLEHKRKELHDDISRRWMQEIDAAMPEHLKGRSLKVLDVGCGTGYIAILLAKAGHLVQGVDLTPEMIEAAKVLAAEEQAAADFEVMDAEQVDYPDETFDLIITRNLTWTLPHPDVAYKNWRRILKKGGALINFDADYGAESTVSMKDLPTDHAHHQIGEAMLLENDVIKSMLAISYQRRPLWDMGFLMDLGFEKLSADTGISARLFPVKDEFYNPTPMFRLTVEK